MDLIPKIYDTTREIILINEDGSDRREMVNVPYLQMQDGYPVTGVQNDLTAGNYNVKVSVGPSYSTQRQEAAEGLTEFVRAIPQAATIAGDLIARNLDWPGAAELADRLKKMLPPGVADDEDPTPEEQMAKMQAMQEQQRQQQMAEMMAQIEMQKTAAEAREATADAARSEAEAVKTGVEAEQMRLEMALQTGALDALLRQRIAEILGGPIQ